MGELFRKKIKLDKKANDIRNTLLKFTDKEMKNEPKTFRKQSIAEPSEEFKIEFKEQFSFTERGEDIRQVNPKEKEESASPLERIEKIPNFINSLTPKTAKSKEKEGINFLVLYTNRLKLKEEKNLKRRNALFSIFERERLELFFTSSKRSLCKRALEI